MNASHAVVAILARQGEASITNSEVSLSIMDIMNGMLNKNLALQVEKKSVALASQEVKTAKSTFLPDVTANANAEPECHNESANPF